MKKSIFLWPFALLLTLIIISCGNDNSKNGSDTTKNDTTKNDVMKTGIQQADWGESDGKKVYLYTLTNKNGAQVKISNYGGTITSWVTPDNKGNKSSIVLGFNELKGYLAHPPYFGATVGRYGNRIANAKFTLNGKTYKLAANNGKNSLHGGLKGFDKMVWDAAPLSDNTPSLTLNYLSKDGEEGYPGNLKVSITFSLSDDNELKIDYNAETDKATPVNLTNHSYFNLTGDPGNTILNQTVMIDADRYTPVDKTLIPTGELKPVKGTPFDFTTAHKVGERIDQVDGGYDHNFVLNKKGSSSNQVVTVTDSLSGRRLEVYTDQPGIQFYTGNFLDGSIKTDDGKPIPKNGALCLETQHFPDSPNKPAFPSTILKPGEKYHTTTTYKVLLDK
ncbi:MAG TPA: aldose epimerase family protein [Segetibacter sp.]